MTTIPTQTSLHGFIATAPQLTFTGNGTARFYARVGVERYRKEPDDTFTRLESTLHALVAFGKNAERAYARFRVGDSFIAAVAASGDIWFSDSSGYIKFYESDHDGRTQAREEFVARRLGHDLARTNYDIDRTPSVQPRQPDPPTTDLPNAAQPAAQAPAATVGL